VFSILLACFCFISCQHRYPKIRVYPRGTYDRGVSSLQDSARVFFPDSIFAHFPPVTDFPDSILLVEIKHTLFAGFPNISISRKLPCIYEEVYGPESLKKYDRIKQNWLKRCSFVIEDTSFYDIVYFSHLSENPESFPSNSTIVLPDGSIKDGSHILILKKGEGLVVNVEKATNSLCQRYVSGITFFDRDQLIDYWILIW
jgi:hypothetical protein